MLVDNVVVLTELHRVLERNTRVAMRRRTESSRLQNA